jgi:hypothetical protein
MLTALTGLMMFFLGSCLEKPTIIGTGLLPSSDFVSIKDTIFSADGYTQYDPSVVSNNPTYSYLGRTYDPYFGDTRLDFVGQLRLTSKWNRGPFVIDSIKLLLTIQAAKGVIDTNYHHKIKIYEILDPLNSSTVYRSNTNPTLGMEVGTFDLPIIRKDTIQTLGVLLPNSFAQYLMRDTTKLTQEDDANDFRTFFRGVYLTMVDAPDPLLMPVAFSTSSLGDISYPYFKVYYRTVPGDIYGEYDFVINSNSVRYNRYTRNFSSADPALKIKHINDGVKDSLIYLQAFNGAYPLFKFPGLENLKKNVKNISVNKARLTLSVVIDSGYFKSSLIPSQIMMKYVVSDTVQYVVPDYYVSSLFFDGTFSTTTLTYTFNIASFVQLYLDGTISKPEVQMYLPTGVYSNVILRGNNSYKPSKLEFVYTRY